MVSICKGNLYLFMGKGLWKIARQHIDILVSSFITQLTSFKSKYILCKTVQNNMCRLA